MSITCAILLAWLSLVFQQPLTVPSTQYIIQITETQYPLLIAALKGKEYTLERIHPSIDYYRLNTAQEIETTLFEKYKSEGVIAKWQHDRKVIQRSEPNDPLFSNQWGMMRIGMPDAWDQTTGGVTVNGDTIVVAILDRGFNMNHEDLGSNIWVNAQEIPGDEEDNDQNGYIDDYRGVNVRTGDDAHPIDIHGVSVAGIIGARGNNNRGIAGVNWNVKMLFISGIQNESDIIEGYEYVKALRDEYASSNGARGAFIVVTNLSAGIDNALPEDHEMWCEQYGSLGQSGILGVCATSNGNTDVDVHGDMPTTCPSEYLIAVTNTDMNDNKLLFAGYGATHVDLAAPGTPSLTTALANGYDDFEGTSAAAPHVAGAVALLYSAACADLMDLADTDPSALALQMKSLIMNHGDEIMSLQTITVSGARLNVAKAMGAMVDLCGNASGDLEILSISPNPVFEQTVIEYNIPDLNPYEINLYDSAGRLIYQEKPQFTTPGIQSFELSASRFVPGVYHFSILQGDNVATVSILVQ